MTSKEKELNQLLNVLYDSVTQINNWQTFGNEVVRLTGTCACEVSVYDPSTQQLQALNLPFLAESDLRFYKEEMINLNPRIPLILKAPNNYNVYSDQFAFDVESIKKSAFFEWVRSLGVQFMAGNIFTLDDNNVFAFLLHQEIKDGLVSIKNLEFLLSLFPHIKRAANLSLLLNRTTVKAQFFSNYLEQATFGIAYLNQFSKVVEMNNLAATYIQSTLLLEVSSQGALGTTTRSNKKVRIFLAQLKKLATGQNREACTLSLRRSHTNTISIIAVPVSKEWSEQTFYLNYPTIALYFIDIGLKQSSEGIQRICAFLGLSPRESQIAEMLYLGHQPKYISHELDIAESTVRAFVRLIHKKLGIHRQSELVRLLAELNSHFFGTN